MKKDIEKFMEFIIGALLLCTAISEWIVVLVYKIGFTWYGLFVNILHLIISQIFMADVFDLIGKKEEK